MLPVNRRRTQIMLAGSFLLLIALVWVKVPSPLIAAIALLPACLAAGLQMPFLLCLAFIAFSFFRLHEVFPALYPLHIPQLLALGTLGSLAVNMLTKRINMFWSRELSVFSFFLFLVIIGSLLATNRSAAMGSLTGTYIKIAAMVFAISWLLRHSRQFFWLLLTMIVSGICVAIVALRNKHLGLELVEGTRVTIGRSIGSMLGDPNDLSLVLLFPASFALALLLTPGFGKLWKLLGLMCFLLVACAVIATQSRGGLLGICAVSGIYAWHRVQNKALLIAMGGAALMVLFVLAGITDRASGGAHEEGIDESAMGRIYAWQAAIGMAIHHPLTGVGLNNFISNYFDYSPHWDGKNHAVHSTWFGVLAETGLLGFAVFIAIIIAVARISSRCRRYFAPGNGHTAQTYDPVLFACAQSVQAGLAGFCVSGTFLTMGFTWPLYIMLALAVALSQYLHRQSSGRL
ncbi:O-antigen ligase family protein [Aliamphritea spongicola]|uniref:O-antigen ligase family protein n=1 Tax=Aliamphritea spongicola TaxID=707589 RepID=UPI00196ACAB4|nr:O-antigen ligase family protein [Aliamphritea spongicola]MBN3560861.1 O-antigen ligase family protein [Aliamphritea spongicola]